MRKCLIFLCVEKANVFQSDIINGCENEIDVYICVLKNRTLTLLLTSVGTCVISISWILIALWILFSLHSNMFMSNFLTTKYQWFIFVAVKVWQLLLWVKTTQGQFWSVSRKSVAGIKMMEDQLELGNLLLQSSLPGPFSYARNFPDHCRNTTNSSMKHFWHCLRSTPCAFICIERMTYTYIANPGFFFEFYVGKISMASNVLPAFVLSRSLTPHPLDRGKKPSE